MGKFVLFICEFEHVAPLFDGLKDQGIRFQVSEDIGEIDKIVFNKTPDLIVLRDGLKTLDSKELLLKIISQAGCLCVVFSLDADVDRAKIFLDAGAWDFWIAPLQLEKILVLLDNEALENDIKIQTVVPKYYEPISIIGEHKKIKIALALAKKVAPSTATVLISGESGTGKEVIAKYIHLNSPRAKNPFIAVNCAALPESLLESELFGYEKGAFTGAYRTKPGKFELAQGGTILLDEISEMDISLQAKLLRVIQEKEIDRLGGTQSIKIDVRIIATTNRDLKDYVEQGKFRQDLYFRLNVIPINLPPLRDRGEDVILLATHFLKKFSHTYGIGDCELSKEAISWLKEYPWPGNIRELENLMERAVLISHGGEIKKSHFLMESLDLDQLDLEQEDISQTGEDKQTGIDLDKVVSLEEMERQMIIKSLETTKGNRTKAAELLGISVRTLRNKLNKLREQGITL